jgi:hypothetical protein
MRYITATIGAIFIFIGVLFVCAVLPWDLSHLKITVHLGLFSVWATPSLLIGVPLGDCDRSLLVS